jgi:hypothetical protein
MKCRWDGLNIIVTDALVVQTAKGFELGYAAGACA